MTQPGYPPFGHGAPSPYGAPPSTHPSYPPVGASLPPAPPPKKKSNLGLVLGLSAGGFLLLAGGGTGLFFALHKSGGALPIEAKMLPRETREVGTQLIEATRESDEKIKNAYLAAELGAELCRPGTEDPAHRLESMGRGSPRAAKRFFFEKKAIDDARGVMECGGLLAGTLDSPYQTVVAFDDGGKTKRVAVGHFRFSEIPQAFGFTRYAFRGLPGFCRTRDDAGSTGTPGEVTLGACNEASYGAFPQGRTWFLGERTALDAMATSVKNPREELNAQVAALKEAAGQTEGLPVVRIQANPKSTREFFMAPCFFGASQSAAPFGEFSDGCFPAKEVEPRLAEIDARVRAAAYETDGDLEKAGQFHGNLVFVARDPDAAKEIEGSIKDVVDDWRDHVETNEAKLIVASRENPSTTRQKKFAVIAESYFRALTNAKVTRKGRAIRVTFHAPISAEEKRGLEDADKSTVERRRAVADVLEAIRAKKAVPQPALAKLVGPAWAAYLAGPAPVEPVVMPKLPMTASECRAVQAKLWSFDSRRLATPEARMLYFNQKYASCATNPPEVEDAQKTCLLSFHGPTEFAACAAPAVAAKPAGEPPDGDFGDFRGR